MNAPSSGREITKFADTVLANLALFPFTSKSDTAFTGDGWEVTGGQAVNTLAGNDVVTGTTTTAGGLYGISINESSTLNTGAGNDVVKGTGGVAQGILIINGGILDNGKGNADHLLRFIRESLGCRLDLSSSVSLRKQSVSLAAGNELIDQFAREADLVITAMAD